MPKDPLHIALHIGAHKTATTHLQRSIPKRSNALADLGVFFQGPQHLRGPGLGLAERLGLQFPGRGLVAPVDVGAALDAMAPGGKRLVLSEENYIGMLQHRRGNIPMPLYPKAAARIAALAGVAAPHGLHVHLGIRSPASFLSSAFGQGLMGGKDVSLAFYKEKNPLIGVDWVDLVGRVRATAGVATLTVWRYEDYGLLFGRICAGLLGDEGGALVPALPDRVHSGLSMAAAAALMANPANQEPAPDVRVALPVGPDNPPFDAFDAEEHALGAEYYAQQVAEIAAMPDVMFLRP